MKVRGPCLVNYTIQPSQYESSFTRTILYASETPPKDERNDINFKQLNASEKEKGREGTSQMEHQRGNNPTSALRI